MAIVIKNTNYSGEVLEQLLTLAATGNELVEKGLIHVEPGVSEKFSIPRLKTGTMLQKRKEQPTDSDSKGDFNYSERVLKPVDFMAFTTFNPRSFEKVWRKWQPTGNLVFAELPPEAQNTLLAELAKQVKFELGNHFINGVEGETDDTLFNGIVFRMKEDTDKIVVTTTATTMIGKLKALKNKIPKVLRANPGLRILMSITDFDTYDDELTQQPNKGANYTDMNVERFKGISIEPLANWPDGLIVATICGMDTNTNLWAAVNLQDDMEVIQIDKLTNAGERYFFKMLMKADTNTAFGEEVIWLDQRTGGGDDIEITVDMEINCEKTAGTNQRTVSVSGDHEWSVEAAEDVDWFTVTKNGAKVIITRQENTTGADRSGTFTIKVNDSSAEETVTVIQSGV